MRKFIKLIYRKLTVGRLLAVLGSFTFAVLVKMVMLYGFDISLIKGGLNPEDISYFISVFSFRLLFSIFLELYLGEKFFIPVGDIYKGFKPWTLSMDNKNQSSSSSKDETGLTEQFKLEDDLSANLDTQGSMINKLLMLKMKNNIKYFLVKGSLELDAPNSISDEQLAKIAKEVGIVDRILNTKFDELKYLEKKFLSSNNKASLDSFTEERRINSELYNNLFEK